MSSPTFAPRFGCRRSPRSTRSKPDYVLVHSRQASCARELFRKRYGLTMGAEMTSRVKQEFLASRCSGVKHIKGIYDMAPRSPTGPSTFDVNVCWAFLNGSDKRSAPIQVPQEIAETGVAPTLLKPSGVVPFFRVVARRPSAKGALP